MAMGSYLSVITLNVNGVNAPTKRQRLAERIQKQDPYFCWLLDPPQTQGHIQTESEGLEKDISHKRKQTNKQKADVAIHVSDKIDFKIKAVKGDKEGH